MNCPVCKSTELEETALEQNLTSLKCAKCNGHWIRGAEYWKWLEEHKSDLAERVHHTEDLTLAEPGLPLDCPECRFRMTKYLVGRGLGFTLDHCSGCKGIAISGVPAAIAHCTLPCPPAVIARSTRGMMR